MAHKQLTTFHLFAGAGGGELADLLLGHLPVGACEIEEYPRNVLLARMRDGILPVHPVWDDINTLDGKPWRGLVDVVCGGFPCQDISAAGKGAGIDGERSGLWGEMARVILEIRPRFAFVENSPMLTSRGLGTVLGDLAEMGYDAKWCVLGACDAGAPHKRDRIWILADRISDGREQGRRDDGEYDRAKPSASSEHGSAEVGNAMHAGLQGGERTGGADAQRRKESHGSATESSGLWWAIDPADICDTAESGLSEWAEQAVERSSAESEPQRRTGDTEVRPTEPLVGRVAHGVAHRVDRLKAIGNGQVPQCAAVAFNILSEGLITG